MNKNTMKIKQITAILLLVIIAQIAPTSNANAGFFDWFRGSNKDASETADSNASYVGPDLRLPEISTSGNTLNPIVAAKGFILPYTAPVATEKEVITIREMTIPATAYSSTPDQTDDTPFITARGTYVRDGIVAANFLPFGTKIKIPDIYGDKIFVVEDRMNRRYWHKIDIWFPDRESALEFGIRTVKIQILES